MKVLQITAHHKDVSFTSWVAGKFFDGATDAGHTVYPINLYDTELTIPQFENVIRRADHICFAWPTWWELPPARLVDWFQTIFVQGFAFVEVDGRMKKELDIPVTCLVSLGRDKTYDTTNLREAMEYCGLHPTFLIFSNVGPRLTTEKQQAYLDLAYREGLNLKDTNASN